MQPPNTGGDVENSELHLGSAMSAYLSSVKHAVQHPLLSWGAALTLWLTIAGGMFDQQSQLALQWVLPITGMVLIWLAWEMYRGVARYWAMEHYGERSYVSWLGLGFALLGGCAMMLRLTGGLYSPFYPLFYLAIAFLTSVGTARQGAYWFGYALLLEFAGVLATFYSPQMVGQNVVGRGALHIVFLGFFAGSHHIYLHGLLWDMRRLRNRKHNYEDLSERASMLRGHQPAVGLTASSVQSIGAERELLFSLLREGLSAHGCALLWLDDQDKTYEVIHIDTQADDIDLGPFSMQAGAPASLFQREDAVRISRGGDTGILLPYYGPSVTVRSWLAMPIRQDNQVRGVLCADRVHSAPFSAREESMMEAISMLFVSTLESQRSFLHSHRDPKSLLQLYEAGQRLNSTFSEAELGQVALEQARSFAPFDWGLVSRYNPFDKTHTVIATTEAVHGLIQQTFSVENTLLSLSLKHNCPLPEKGILRSAAPILATVDPELPNYASLSIVPLKVRDEANGCIIMGSRDPQMFADLKREKNIGTLAHHLSALLDNTEHQKYRDGLSELDNLTQLYNYRSMMEALQQRLEAAHQYNKRLSVLVMDVDQFQELNARFGYTTGDRVLVQMAKLIQHTAREIDVVARYAGDEFVLVLDETSRASALRTADRLLSRVAKMEFLSEGEEPEAFSITLSIGVATYPDNSTQLNELLLGAEEACRQAKERGGHRAVLHTSPAIGEAHEAPPSVADLLTKPPPGWGRASSAPMPHGEYSKQGVLEHLSILEAERIGDEPVSISGILEAVIQSNKAPSEEGPQNVSNFEAIRAASALAGLPEEPPYPNAEMESPMSHDSTADLPENMELLSPESFAKDDPADLNTPQPDNLSGNKLGFLPDLYADDVDEPSPGKN